jgi:hypothetical protein
VYVFARRYRMLRALPPRRGRHRANPPEIPARNRCLAYAPAGGPMQGPLSGVVSARSAAFGGRLRVTLVLGFFARLLCERGLLPRCLWGLAAAFVALGLSRRQVDTYRARTRAEIVCRDVSRVDRLMSRYSRGTRMSRVVRRSFRMRVPPPQCMVGR